jgi:hypothetical protein
MQTSHSLYLDALVVSRHCLDRRLFLVVVADVVAGLTFAVVHSDDSSAVTVHTRRTK